MCERRDTGEKGNKMASDRAAVQAVLDQVRAEGRTVLTAPEGKQVCEAYGIPVPQEGLATSAPEAGRLAQEIGYPVVLKIASTDILHKTDAGGVLTGLASAAAVEQGYNTILANARAYKADAHILGVQVQQMLPAAQEVIVGAVTDPSFGKLVAFGLGGILVEVMQDITFRLAPATRQEAVSMLDDIAGAAVLRGVRGAPGVDREALGTLIENVSQSGARLSRHPRDGPQPGVCQQHRGHSRGRAYRGGFRYGTAALPAGAGRDPAGHATHHAAQRCGGYRCHSGRWQDR